jgi:fructose-1,6-bisphosphatase/inositol monophosphatase family enzyme
MPKAPAPADFVRTLAPVLRQAASVARALEGRVANRPKHGEPTAVKAALTVADTAAQEALLFALLENFPQVRLEAEEDTPSARRFPADGDALVVIDPIDGTLLFYLEGAGPYAVMIGLALELQYEAALVALPREGLYFDAVRGGGARITKGSRPVPVGPIEASGNLVFVSPGLPDPAVEHLRARGFEVAPACGGAIAVAPLIPGVRAGLRVAAEDSAGVSIRGRIGALIAAEAGALVCRESGDPFPRDIGAPARALLVAANESDLRALQDALSAAGLA